jgi:hypothetical protein
MKNKLLFLFLFLGSYIAYCQVGIGTPLPNASAQLEVVATDKGILIPKVNLTSSTDATTIVNGNVNSLLIFNTATISDITPGYYYWYDNKWNRIVISNEITNIPDTVIYNPTTQQFTYVDGLGITQTIDFTQIVAANETLTTLTNNGAGSYTYKNEAGTDVNIEVVGDVITNASAIFNDPAVTTILQEISSKTEGSVTFNPTTNQFSYVDNSGNTQVVDINSIIKANETITTQSQNLGTGTITYTNEAGAVATSQVISTDTTNILKVGTDGGALLTPSEITTATTVSNTSMNNNLSTTVNGVLGAGVPIINSNETSLTGSTLTTTVNGVTSTALDLSPAIEASQIITNLVQDTSTGVITYTNENAVDQTAVVKSTDAGNLLIVGTDGGALLTPAAITAATTVSNTSLGNDLSTTVNGVTGTAIPIINSNVLATSGNTLTTTINGVASNAIDLSSAIAAGTTNTLSLVDNTLTSNVNGVSTTSNAVSGVSNASAVNTSTVTVNGVTSSGAPIINSNVLATSGNALTATVNGVASNAIDLSSAIAAGTTNSLSATNGSLISTVNGVATTPAVPVLISANNGLTVTNGNAQLNGALITPTTITTDATNTLTVAGLQTGTATDNIVVADATGVLKTIAQATLNTNNWNILGNSGTNATTNFIGTTDDNDLVFRRNNDPAGRLNSNNTALGMFAFNPTSTGTYDVAIGRYTLASNTSGFNNTAIGDYSSYLNTTGGNNTANGHIALYNNTAGNGNTASGYGALYGNIDGSNNSAYGTAAGTNNTTGSNNTFLGYLSDITASGLNLTNVTAIGYNAKVATSNSLVLGGTAASAVNVGIGNTAPTNTLHVTPVSGLNPVRFEGLLSGTSADNIVVVDATGVLKTITPSSIIPATTVSNTSSVNNLSTTVNGVLGTAVPIINTNATSLTGTSLITTVNGIASSALDLTPAIATGQTITNLAQNPLTGVLTYTNENAVDQTAVVKSANAGNILTIGTDGGVLLTPSTITSATTVSNTSSGNDLSTTVNGITGTAVNMINTNATSLIGTSLITTVNGVSSNALDLTPAIATGTTNDLSLTDNTLTSNVNGVISTSSAVSGVSNTSTGNTSTVTVNGMSSLGAPIINTNVLATTGNTLTTTINGVASNAIDLTPAIAAGTTNDLSLTGNTLTSNVNGVISTSGAVSGVSNASTGNTSTVTVNGLSSLGAPIINTNVLATTGNTLTATINGVASNAIDLTAVIAAGTTNDLSLTDNTLTSNVNGVISTSGAVSGVSNTSTGNTSTVTVNGLSSLGAPIINTNATSLTGTSLITTVNGIASSALDLAPAIATGQTITNLAQNPLTGILTYTNENAVDQTAVIKSANAGNILTIGTDGGVLLTPSTITSATTVYNTSSGNDLSTTVNGVLGTAVPIINTNATSLTGASLITTVNGVSSSALDLTPAIATGQTITSLAQDPLTGVITYTNEAGTPMTSNVVSANAGNLITVGTDGGSFIDNAVIKANETVTTVTPIVTTGNVIATYLNEAGGTPVDVKETITTLSYNSTLKTLNYSGEGTSTAAIDLVALVDNATAKADLTTTTPVTVLAVTGTAATLAAATVDIVPSVVEGDVLTTTATGVAWKAPAKPNVLGIKVTSDDYTLVAEDYTVIARNLTKDITLTLPDATANTGRILVFNQNTVFSGGTALVVNFNVPVIYSDTASYPYIAAGLFGGTTGGSLKITLQSDGTNWYVINYTM